jgi:membrane-bound lytic murein transglycosylase B
MKKIGLLCVISAIIASIYSSAGNNDKTELIALTSPAVKIFINEFKKENIYTEKELENIFSKTVIKKKKIISAQKNQAEKNLTWAGYKKIVVTNTRIQGGKLFILANENSLMRAESIYNVDKEIITAILGVETNYGFKKGDYRAIDSLSTLAFEYYPRGDFFKTELKEFLKYTKKNNLSPFSIESSWAGAIGYPQFIPSSINNYAVDFDNDGKIDLVNSVDDSIGSIANYLNKNGFKKESYYFNKLNIKETAVSNGLKLDKNCSIIKVADEYCKDKFKIFKLDDNYYIGGRTFYAITTYNRSNLYAAAVLEIAKALSD